MHLTLQHGAYRAQVDTMGGELISCRDGQGLEYIWQGDAAVWPGRNPLLFPIVGALADATVCFAGRAYRMQRHGFARRQEFAVTGHGENWAELELRDSPETRAAYPYPFRLRVRQTLGEGGFTTAVTVENPGPAELPFCLGAHTGFCCPLLPGERFEDYELVFAQPETCPALIPKGGGLDRGRTAPGLENARVLPLRYETFDALDTLVFEGLRSRSVTLRHRTAGRGVRVDFSGFPGLALWTMPDKHAPYLCIEPWHGCPHMEGEGTEFTDKAYCIRLAPGAARTLSYRVALL